MQWRRKIGRNDIPSQKAGEGKSSGNQDGGYSEVESESPRRRTSETFIIILFTFAFVLALAPPRPNSQIHIRDPLRGGKRYREDDELPVIRRLANLQNRPVLG